MECRRKPLEKEKEEKCWLLSGLSCTWRLRFFREVDTTKRPIYGLWEWLFVSWWQEGLRSNQSIKHKQWKIFKKELLNLTRNSGINTVLIFKIWWVLCLKRSKKESAFLTPSDIYGCLRHHPKKERSEDYPQWLSTSTRLFMNKWSEKAMLVQRRKGIQFNRRLCWRVLIL